MLHTQQCIIIGIDEGSEKFARFHLFSKDEGLQLALRRKSSTRSGVQHADLFQTVEIVLEQKPDMEFSFVKETQILTERNLIAKNYAAFENASKFCKAIKLNALHMENPRSIFDLLEQCLNAWNNKGAPHTVFLKSIFRLASEEGFPVRQLWLGHMNPKQREKAHRILTQPLQSLSFPDLESKEFAESLTSWLTHQQDFLF